MGPLKGRKIVEIAGIGPGPMCAMLLADLGAEVVRVDRTVDSGLGLRRGKGDDSAYNLLARGRKSVAVDLKKPEGVETVLRLVEQADGLIEGFRPGVTERLGIGPDVCLERNPRLVYGRMTGWGQHGPLAQAAGHDINYIALTGALHAIGRKDSGPVPPLNLVGDFGGGALYLAFGIVAAMLEAERSGKGQVVDAAMTDGAASLMTIFYGMHASGMWRDERGVNVLDTGSHFYEVYETADGKHVSIGSIEPKFYAELVRLAGLEGEELAPQMDPANWPGLRARFAEIFRRKTREEWCAIMEGTDVCFAPVLSLAEAPGHPHNKARETFVEVAGIVQPNVAPRFSRTPGAVRMPPAKAGEHSREILADWGFSEQEIGSLLANKAVLQQEV
ncbi:CaiB/BaiF CoA transferase family protein [Oceanibacterium hippocampi]|uniref:Formyl-coenzyme A transferase n=1 Tax=Oceanibacterium hippocampi TaxID=745714 RepID=A0A1Y5TDV7_9PROT|nr:Formyl-coenzyme A transferase [Oceanibacterium hippocampi]